MPLQLSDNDSRRALRGACLAFKNKDHRGAFRIPQHVGWKGEDAHAGRDKEE